MNFVLKTESLKKFLKIGSIEELNGDFFRLYNLINNHDYSMYSSIGYHDGLLDIDLKIIKGRLKNIFGTNNVLALRTLRDDINLRGTNAYVRIKGLYKYYQNYMKNITRDKVHFKRGFNRDLVHLIDAYIDLLENPLKYSRLDVDPQVANLFIANSLMLDCKKWESWQDKDRLKYFFDLLTEFISEHYDLFLTDFRYKDVSAREVAEYIGVDFEEPKEENQKNIESLGYTFFESKELPTERLVSGIMRFANNETRQRDLKPFLERKLALYRSLNYTKIMVGKERFSGYIGFVLENGYVVLDKLFESESTGKIAIDNAIYVIKESEFDELTRLSKTEMIERIKSCEVDATRIIHTGDYEKRLKKVIESTEE